MIGLGEAELAAGRDGAAATSRSCGAEERLLNAAGVNTDAELAVFEADHGDPVARASCWRGAAWAARAERALGRRARLGADPRRPSACRPGAGRTARCGSARSIRCSLEHAGLTALPRAGSGGRCCAARSHTASPPIPGRRRACGRRCDEAPAAASPRLALLALPATAGAHPLGNFSVNHLTEVRVSPDRVDVRYILDQAEIPTFQERGLPAAVVLARKRAEVARGGCASPSAAGRVALVPARPARLTHPPGQGGLPHTRVELPLAARVRTLGTVTVHDGTFPGRIGWHAVVPLPGRGTAVRSNVPVRGPDGRPAPLPAGPAASPPAAIRDARLVVRSGAGTVQAPHGRSASRWPPAARAASPASSTTRPPAAACSLLLLAAAFGWGALHALSPGHGKTMVAAYLVGTRGSTRDAIALGATVTVTHTAGVFALGFVALALSAWILPEQLYPWLNLVSGLLVVGVGAAGAAHAAEEARAPPPPSRSPPRHQRRRSILRARGVGRPDPLSRPRSSCCSARSRSTRSRSDWC